MSALHKLLTSESVILELAETDHEEVVLEMIGHLSKIGKVSSGDCYCVGNAVLERESHISTGQGSGVAIPHAKVKGLKETLVVFGRSREGIDFDCPDNVPSNLIFLMLVPEDQGARHLQLLAEVARFFHKADQRKALMEATTAEEICQIFDSAVTA